MFNYQKFFLKFMGILALISCISCVGINILAAALEEPQEAYNRAIHAKMPGPRLVTISSTYSPDIFNPSQCLAISNALINEEKVGEAAKWLQLALRGDHRNYDAYDYYAYIAETLGLSLEAILLEDSADQMQRIIAKQISDKSTLSRALDMPEAARGSDGSSLAGKRRRDLDENTLTAIQVGECIVKYYKKKTGRPIKPVVLQKMTIYSNYVFGAKYSNSLIRDEISHYRKGLIYYDLWEHFREAPGRNIEVGDDDVDESLFSERQMDVIMGTIDFLKDYREYGISKLNHDKDPLWFGLPRESIIPSSVALEFYSTQGKSIDIIQGIIARTAQKDQQGNSTQLVETSSTGPHVRGEYIATRFTAELDGCPMRFEEADVARDNSCGFHALGITRERAVEQLRAAVGDAEIRAFVGHEIKESFTLDDLPRAMKDAAYAGMRTKYEQKEALDQEIGALVRGLNDSLGYVEGSRKNPQDLLLDLQTRGHAEASVLHGKMREIVELEEEIEAYCNSELVYLSFIEHHLNRNGWLGFTRGSVGSLDAIARLNGLRVYIWHKDRADPTRLQLSHEANYGASAAPQTIHMLHTDGNTHYNFLIEAVR
jgi:uncharacterized phage-associated protein